MNEQKVVYPYNRYYSATKRNEILIHATAWVTPENFMLSERARHIHTKDILYDSITVKSTIRKSIETKSRLDIWLR